MKKSYLITGAFVAAMAVSSATAQDFATSIGQGSKAILFTFNGLSALGAGSYNGGIGGKFFLSPALALRAGLQFANSSTTIPANPQAGQVGTDGSN